MTILIDHYRHMVSTKNVEELHHFANNISLKPEWFQEKRRAFKHPHYDLTSPNKVHLALTKGAVMVPTRNLIKRAWWSRLLSK